MISVVICTRDRAAKLERCLQSIQACRPPAQPWQVVVVDNGSVDSTEAVVRHFAERLPLAYVYEPRRGLSHARNRGIAEARHGVIAFTDDDCLVDREWLCTIAGHFMRDKTVSIIGGKVDLAAADDAPVGVRLHQSVQRVTSAQQLMALMSGCNMCFRRRVFEQVGLFDPGLGKGQRLGSAEDIDMMYRALRRGHAIQYTPALAIRHAHGRNTPEVVERLAREYVRGRGAFYAKFIGDRPIARMAYWEARGLLRQCRLRPGGARQVRLLGELVFGAVYRWLTIGASAPKLSRARLSHQGGT